MQFPYILCFDSDSVQHRTLKVIRETARGFCLISHLPRAAFFKIRNISFSYRIHLVNCFNSRIMAYMYNVQSMKSNICHSNSRIPYYNRELSSDILRELIVLFYSQGATVIDPYNGKITTAVSSLKTVRRYVSIKKRNITQQLPTKSRFANCIMDLIMPTKSSNAIMNKTYGQHAVFPRNVQIFTF